MQRVYFPISLGILHSLLCLHYVELSEYFGNYVQYFNELFTQFAQYIICTILPTIQTDFLYIFTQNIHSTFCAYCTYHYLIVPHTISHTTNTHKCYILAHIGLVVLRKLIHTRHTHIILSCTLIISL